MFARAVWLILRKDLTVEVRSREIAYTTLFFAVSCVLVFAFALVREGRAPEDGAAGHPVDRDRVCRARWRSAGRSSASGSRKRCARCCWRRRRGRRSTSASCSASSRCCSARELVLVPLVALLFQAPLLRAPVLAGGRSSLAGTIGFAAVGTLFAAMLVRARSRDVLLPVLLYPITVPVIIAGVRGTAALLQPELDAGDRPVLARAARLASTSCS